MRVCKVCDQPKALNDFRFRQDKNWRVKTCIPCEAAEKVGYYQRMKETDPLRWRVQVLKSSRSKLVTAEWLIATLEAQGWKCALSGRPIDLATLEVDHIVPRRDGGGHELGNLQLVCREANAAKGALSQDELLSLCRDILAHHELIGNAILASLAEQRRAA